MNTKPNIHLFVAGYGLADDLIKCYEAATQDNVTFHLFLHSRRPLVVEACEKISRNSNVFYYPYGEDRGIARSMNEAIIASRKAGADVFICYSDDVIAGPGDIDALAEGVLSNPECSYCDGVGYVERVGAYHPLGLVASALSMKALDTVGFLDQSFVPLYFEDCDWKYRTKLCGMSPVTMSQTKFIHGGSKSLTHVDGEQEVFDKTFVPNRDHYIQKWGGDQFQEQFLTPFNNPKFGLYIGEDNLEDPYPGYARANVSLP